MTTARLEAFSDGVFGFAFTLLILDFHVPDSTAGLFAFLLSQWPQLLGFAVSALLIGLIWADHRAIFLHVKTADRGLVFLNTLLLADIAFLPFPTSLLAKAISTNQGLSEAAFFYGFMLVIGGLLGNALWFYARSRMIAAPGETSRQHLKSISLRFVAGPAAYFVAALCAFFSPWLSIALYVGLIVFFWLPGRTEEPLSQAAATE